MQGGLLLSFAMHNFKHRSFQTRTTRPANSCCFLFYLTTMQVLDWSQRIQPQHRQHSSAPSLGQPSGSEVVFGPWCLRGKSSFSNRGFLFCPLWPLRWAAGKLAGQLYPVALPSGEDMGRDGQPRGHWGWYSAVCYKRITGFADPLVDVFTSIYTLLRRLLWFLFLWTGFWSITFILNCFLNFGSIARKNAESH